MKRVLTIGGSESAGAAGVAVDLRVFDALGVHGAVAITAVTAQPDGGLQAVKGSLLAAQIRAAGPVDAVKIGLILGAEHAHGVLAGLDGVAAPLVFDPVAGPSRGEAFGRREKWRESVLALLPRTTLLTPNLPELEALLDTRLDDRDATLTTAARTLLDRGAGAVLVKGGHRSLDPDDLLVTRQAAVTVPGERIAGRFRGTGCLLSSAIAAYLARGRELETAVREAKGFLEQALRDGREDLPHVFFEFYGCEGLP